MSALPLVIRRATPDDSGDLLRWRNEAETRRQSKTTEPVAAEDHARWFESSLANPARVIWIAESSNQKCGMVRFDRLETEDARQDVWLVSIAVAADARGQGAGRAMLEAACARMEQERGARCFEAEIRVENAASIRIFTRCGFVAAHTPAYAGFLTLYRAGAHRSDQP